MIFSFAASAVEWVTWLSNLIAQFTTPLAVVAIAVASVYRKRRSVLAGCAAALLWPMRLNVWVVGVVWCVAAWGWVGLIIVFVVWMLTPATTVFLSGGTAWLGVFAAYMAGATDAAVNLGSTCVLLLVLQLLTAWLFVKASNDYFPLLEAELPPESSTSSRQWSISDPRRLPQ